MGEWPLSDKVGICRMQKVATLPSVIVTLKCDKSTTKVRQRQIWDSHRGIKCDKSARKVRQSASQGCRMPILDLQDFVFEGERRWAWLGLVQSKQSGAIFVGNADTKRINAEGKGLAVPTLPSARRNRTRPRRYSICPPAFRRAHHHCVSLRTGTRRIT